MEVAKHRVLVRASTTALKQKEKEGASMLAPKIVGKGTSKRKSEGKDNHPLKKGLGTPASDKQSKQPLPPKLDHKVGKGLMTATGPVTQVIVRRLLTHKEHVVEMVESIIKETDLDPYAEQMTKDLGASGLFDLARVFFLILYSISCFIHLLTVVKVL